jgi:hypothetical protein
VTAAVSATVTPGDIISESPVAGTYVDVGSAVNITVSGISVPNVFGQALNAAEGAITGAGLAVGNLTQSASATVPAGVVIGQNPAAAAVALPGASVDLVVSSGLQNMVPNVVGMTQANAATAIGNAGLAVGNVTTTTSVTVPAGNVIGESPAAGTLANAGTAVNLVVSGGLPLVSIAVTPANPAILVGATQQFTATGTYSDTSTHDLTNQATWTSATTSVATVSGLGLATGSAVGTSTIGAALGTVSGSTVLKVTAAQCSPTHGAPYTVADVKSIINQALGVSPPSDLNADGAINVADAQIVVNAVMGMGCITH